MNWIPWIQTLLLIVNCISWYYSGKQKGKDIATKIFSEANEKIQKTFWESREKTVKNYEAQLKFLIDENKELQGVNEFLVKRCVRFQNAPHDLCTDKNNFGGEGKDGL